MTDFDPFLDDPRDRPPNRGCAGILLAMLAGLACWVVLIETVRRFLL